MEHNYVDFCYYNNTCHEFIHLIVTDTPMSVGLDGMGGWVENEAGRGLFTNGAFTLHESENFL